MALSLYDLAVEAADKAHAPYSKFHVGVALETTDGRRFSGCNIENASYPEGWCAETTAISQMVMDGGGTIAQMAVFSPQMDKITPCGGCRQRISEFGSAETVVHLSNKEGIVESLTMADLLPRAFDM